MRIPDLDRLPWLVMNDGELVSIRAAARRLGISRELITRAIRNGELRAFKPGERWTYVRLDEVRTWIEAQAVQPLRSEMAERVDASFRRARLRARKTGR